MCSSPSDRLSHQARISASVNAMRILNTGTEVEAAVADALVGTEVKKSFFFIDNQTSFNINKQWCICCCCQSSYNPAVISSVLFLPGLCKFQLLGDSRSKVQINLTHSVTACRAWALNMDLSILNMELTLRVSRLGCSRLLKETLTESKLESNHLDSGYRIICLIMTFILFQHHPLRLKMWKVSPCHSNPSH